MTRIQSRSGGRISRNAGGAGSSRSLLNANTDFTFLGKYYAASYGGTNSLDLWAQGLTHRYVGGTFRLMWLGFGGNGSDDASLTPIREATLPGSFDTFTPVVATHTNTWANMSGIGRLFSIWWDDQNNKAWVSQGIEYPDNSVEASTGAMNARSIGTSGGSCTDHSAYHGLYGIQQRSAMGKMGRVPTWAQTAYGFKEYISYSGGYASRMSYGVSLGPIFTSFDNPLSFTGSATPDQVAPTVPQASVQILADLRSGTSPTDWYAGGYASRTKERGCRVSNCTNDYDTPYWQSKPVLQPPGDPDGWNRWTWGDSFGGTGNWIDNDAGTRGKHGVVLVQKLNVGRTWYEGSQLNGSGNAYEIVVYDPADMHAVKEGTLDAWKIRPKSIAVIPYQNIGIGEVLANTSVVCTGATFDIVTNRLYVLIGNQNLITTILVYQVAT